MQRYSKLEILQKKNYLFWLGGVLKKPLCTVFCEFWATFGSVHTERCFVFKGHALPRHRVCECYSCSMQTEPFGTLSVERIAVYRAVKSLVVGAVHTQLVRASGVRCEFNEGASPVGGNDVIVGDSLLAVLMADSLAWTVHDIRAERQVYRAVTRLSWDAVEQCGVFLLHLALCKLALQQRVNFGIACHE